MAFSDLQHHGDRRAGSYGRGSSDCKGLLTSQLMAMRLLKRNSVDLQDGLNLASGADEEHGGRYGSGWLAQVGTWRARLCCEWAPHPFAQ